MLEAKSLSDIPGIRHGFFTREGGHSRGLYASLNCGLGSGDDKAVVRRNRDVVAERMGVAPGSLITVWQWHSPDVKLVEEPWDPLDPPKADAMVTTTPGIALGILAADCAPVLFASGDGRVVGAAHAGWKGAIAGVLEATIAAMAKLGARPDAIRAGLGPTINQASYEVGPEFRESFLSKEASSAAFFKPSTREGHSLFDLPAYVRSRLATAGVASVSDQSLCTYADERHFFSFRRTTHRKEPDYGRQISAISINPA